MASGFSSRLSNRFRRERMKVLFDTGRVVDINTCNKSFLLELRSPYGDELWERHSPEIEYEGEWTIVKQARLVTSDGNPKNAVREAKLRGLSFERVLIRF